MAKQLQLSFQVQNETKKEDKVLFKMYELVDIMRQRDDLDFTYLLNRLRLNEITGEEKLQTCIVDHDSDDYPKNALHLFAENKLINEHCNKISG